MVFGEELRKQYSPSWSEAPKPNETFTTTFHPPVSEVREYSATFPNCSKHFDNMLMIYGKFQKKNLFIT